MSFTSSEIAFLFQESIQFLGQSFINLITTNIRVIYIQLVIINLICMYYNYKNNSFITKEEKKTILEIVNEKKTCDSQSDSQSDSESVPEPCEEDDDLLGKRLQENLRLKVQDAKTVIVESIYELLLVNPELKNAEISRELGLQSSEHNGYISLILMKQSGLFCRDPESKLWSID